MKSFTSIFMLCVFMAASLSAQDRGARKGQTKERIQALRIAFITKKIDLTEKEAEKFWPVYNEYQKERKKLRDMEKRKKGTTVTDAEADAMVDASFEIQEKQLKLRRTYYDRFKKIIPSQKIVLLERAEKEFRRKVVNEIKRRKKEKGEHKRK